MSRLQVLLIAMLCGMAMTGCDTATSGDGTASSDAPVSPAVITAYASSYGTCTSPGDETTYVSRVAVDGEVEFTESDTVYVAAQLSPGVSITDVPRATCAFYVDPVDEPLSATPVFTSGTLRFWTVGGNRTTFLVNLGTLSSAYPYTVRVVVTPVDGFPDGTTTQTIRLPHTLVILPTADG